jgi:hypothetical protein
MLGWPSIFVGCLGLIALLGYNLPSTIPPLAKPMKMWGQMASGGHSVEDSRLMMPTIDFWIYILPGLALGVAGAWYSRKSGRPRMSIAGASICGLDAIVGYVLIFIGS